MHPVMRDAIRELVEELPATRVLEVGATRADTLLDLPCLSGCVQRTGINQDPSEISKGDGWEICRGSGHSINMPDGYFDLVLCNSVLEHDPFFWKTLAEMKRVLNGYLVIGVPAFVESCGTVLGVHRFPKDYYRFGIDAFREVMFEGMIFLGSRVLMPPHPRILGWGRTP